MQNNLRTDANKYPEIRKILSDERRDYVSKVITVQTDKGTMNMPTKGKTMVEAVNTYQKNPKGTRTKLYKNAMDAYKNAQKGKI